MTRMLHVDFFCINKKTTPQVINNPLNDSTLASI